MHLLAAQPGNMDEGNEPVDLGQTPADVVFMSAADTEIAALSAARSALDTPPTLRLANLAYLRHPMSVDQHIENCASKSKLVIVRVLGGKGYWPYGLEQYAIALGRAGIAFVPLPGDDKPDEELARLATVSADDYNALWAYLVEGGALNAGNFLRYAGAMLSGDAKPPAASPLLRAGVYWPGSGVCDDTMITAQWNDNAPVVPLIFYRALVQGAGLNPINRLVKSLLRRGLNPLPIFVASLKDPVSAATLETLFLNYPPAAILNCTAFAVGSAFQGDAGPQNPLAATSANSAPVFQVVLSGTSESGWEDSLSGLSPRDIAMNVALPEVDGRILTRAVSFKDEAFFDEATQCPVATYRANGNRVAFVAELTANWVKLRRKTPAQRRVALIMANYPNKDGRIANGVGLDTPAATLAAMQALTGAGYETGDLPKSAGELMDQILAGPTNWLADSPKRAGGQSLSVKDYDLCYQKIPLAVRQQIEDRWGAPVDDPFVKSGAFKLSIHRFGNLCLGVQPARGYNIDPKETYHSPDLIPPHNYLAFYFWLRFEFGVDGLVNMGKHGNLEWLPGKALVLSDTCLPEVTLGPTPTIYPFIVNDPGEGTQAKRRSSAVIIDHLTPPLSRAESYGPLRDLEALVDEFYDASGVDPRRVNHLKSEILALTSATGIDLDAGLDGVDESTDLTRLDSYLCDLKEAQIRDGLHVLGTAPVGRLERDLLQALVRIPRGDGAGGNASLPRALAVDLALDFDPLECEMGAPWTGPKPEILESLTPDTWRSCGDTVERLELLCAALLDGKYCDGLTRARAVLDMIESHLRPTLQSCGPAEMHGLLAALDGRFVPPGPSGAPTRGRPDVLPTGRNFFSVDNRAVPTPTAWKLGWKSASLLIEKYLQDFGDWPRSMLITAWGTANMRTGGDDVAQALALMGVKPRWDSANRRVTGFEILPLSVLDRPRVDVTLRVSGFFRDAFPQQIDLIDSAARAVMALDEPHDMNPAAACFKSDSTPGGAYRVFGAKPGAYGAGLQAMIDEKLWRDKADLAEAYLEWGGYAYGQNAEGKRARKALETRLSQVEAVVQNQDNREHDLLDSDDYYQFEGGAAAAVSTLQGCDRPVYHNDHSRPERPVIRTLDDEIGRVVRARVVNPKWISGMKRHGYKGAFEMAATVDYLFAFSATTGAVKNHHFDLVHAAFLEDDDTRQFIEDNNAPALKEIAERLIEAVERGLWVPKSNSAQAMLAGLIG